MGFWEYPDSDSDDDASGTYLRATCARAASAKIGYTSEQLDLVFCRLRLYALQNPYHWLRALCLNKTLFPPCEGFDSWSQRVFKAFFPGILCVVLVAAFLARMLSC